MKRTITLLFLILLLIILYSCSTDKANTNKSHIGYGQEKANSQSFFVSTQNNDLVLQIDNENTLDQASIIIYGLNSKNPAAWKKIKEYTADIYKGEKIVLKNMSERYSPFYDFTEGNVITEIMSFSAGDNEFVFGDNVDLHSLASLSRISIEDGRYNSKEILLGYFVLSLDRYLISEYSDSFLADPKLLSRSSLPYQIYAVVVKCY